MLDGVRLLGVTVEGSDVLVDVYGSEDNACGSVRYHFPDRRQRRSSVNVLRRWAAEDTTVTMVTNGSTVTLLDERALLERALQA